MPHDLGGAIAPYEVALILLLSRRMLKTWRNRKAAAAADMKHSRAE